MGSRAAPVSSPREEWGNGHESDREQAALSGDSSSDINCEAVDDGVSSLREEGEADVEY